MLVAQAILNYRHFSSIFPVTSPTKRQYRGGLSSSR